MYSIGSLDGQDVHSLGSVDPVDEAGESRGLACTRGACGDDQAVAVRQQGRDIRW